MHSSTSQMKSDRSYAEGVFNDLNIVRGPFGGSLVYNLGVT